MSSPVLNLIRRLAEDRRVRDLPDQDLLRRFSAQRDEAAFHTLLRRHGPMVLDVCRGVLGRAADAEDAFQATFLILTQKAGSIRKAASLGSWLHGVAYRTALKARARSTARLKVEARAPGRQAAEADGLDWREVRQVLHEELVRIPARYREPLVLCYLEGATQEHVAARLGLAERTLRERLERGRGLLRARLVRRGLGPAALLAVAAWPAAAASAGVPAPLLDTTVKAAASVVAGDAVAAAVPAKAAALAEGVMKAMLLSKAKGVAAVLLAAAVLGGTFTAYAHQALAEGRDAERKEGTGRSPDPATRHSAEEEPGPPASGRKAKEAADPRVKAALGEAERDAAAIENPFDRAVAFGHIALAHARAGRREAAAAVLRKALEAEGREQGRAREQHRENRLWIIAEYQAETGDVKGALETIDGGVSDTNRTAALRYVAGARARAGDIKGALAVVERMRPARADDPFKDEALQRIAVTQAEAGDSKGALETAARVGRDMDKALALAAVVTARVKAGDADGAAKLVEQVRGLVPAAGAPRDFGLVALAVAQAAVGRAEDALTTVKDISEAQMRDGALWSVATAQAARGDVKAARRTAEAIGDGYLKGEVLKEVVTALVRARDLPGAAKAAAGVGHDIGRCYALMEVARGQAAAGRKEEAGRTLEEARNLAERLEDPPRMGGVRASALAHYAGARAAAGDPDGALAWAAKQEDSWVRAIARIRVAEALAAAKTK